VLAKMLDIRLHFVLVDGVSNIFVKKHSGSSMLWNRWPYS